MKTACILALTMLTGSLAGTEASAWDQDFFAMYIQRSDTIALGAGNAKNVNAATHVIDPWPRYVGNRHIPGNGERMAGAVERYRDVNKLRQRPVPILPIFGTTIGVFGGGGGGETSQVQR